MSTKRIISATNSSIVKSGEEYLVDHVRLMHKTDESRMFLCTLGKCANKPKSFPNNQRLEKHKTTHADVKCDHCDKRFTAKRNLSRHIKKKHPIQDDPLSDMVDRAEIVIQHWELKDINLLTKGFFPNKVYLLAVYVNITTHS